MRFQWAAMFFFVFLLLIPQGDNDEVLDLSTYCYLI